MAIVRDEHELGVLANLAQDRSEAAHIAFIQHRVHLVQQREGGGADTQQREYQRAGDKRALATGEQRKPLLTATGQPRDDLHASVA